MYVYTVPGIQHVIWKMWHWHQLDVESYSCSLSLTYLTDPLQFVAVCV